MHLIFFKKTYTVCYLGATGEGCKEQVNKVNCNKVNKMMKEEYYRIFQSGSEFQQENSLVQSL